MLWFLVTICTTFILFTSASKQLENRRRNVPENWTPPSCEDGTGDYALCEPFIEGITSFTCFNDAMCEYVVYMPCERGLAAVIGDGECSEYLNCEAYLYDGGDCGPLPSSPLGNYSEPDATVQSSPVTTPEVSLPTCESGSGYQLCAPLPFLDVDCLTEDYCLYFFHSPCDEFLFSLLRDDHCQFFLGCDLFDYDSGDCFIDLPPCPDGSVAYEVCDGGCITEQECEDLYGADCVSAVLALEADDTCEDILNCDLYPVENLNCLENSTLPVCEDFLGFLFPLTELTDLRSGSSIVSGLEATLFDPMAPASWKTPPKCKDAMYTYVCARGVDKQSHFDYWGTEPETLGPRLPMCRSVCDDFLLECQDYLNLQLFYSESLDPELQWITTILNQVLLRPGVPLSETCDIYPTSDCYAKVVGDDDMLDTIALNISVPLTVPSESVLTVNSTVASSIQNAAANVLGVVPVQRVVFDPRGIGDGFLSVLVTQPFYNTSIPSLETEATLAASVDASSSEVRSRLVDSLIVGGMTCVGDCSADAVALGEVASDRYRSTLSEEELVALDALYETCGGDGWNDNYHWTTDGDPCRRYGVQCCTATDECTYEQWREGVGVGAKQMHVISLDLSDNELYCDAAISVEGLAELRILDLGGNHLFYFPLGLETLPSLEELLLYEANIEAEFPSVLSQLTTLKALRLGVRSIPVNGISQTSYFPVIQNQISGELDFVGSLLDLEWLDVSFNAIGSTLPESICTLSRLQQLQLFSSDIGGTIPACMGNMVFLTAAFLHSNNLSGSLPEELGSLRSLRVLSLHSNYLSGTVPDGIFCELPSILELLLYSNAFEGSIPACISNLSTLQAIYLMSNNFSGTLPASLGELELYFLALNDNEFSGTLPPELGNIDTLAQLMLSGNDFTGTIPTFLRYFARLQIVMLNDNDFYGTLPPVSDFLYCSNSTSSSTICAPLLELIDLSENNLTGTLPNDWSTLNNVRYIMLNGNAIKLDPSADLPFCSLTLFQLELADNNMGGTLPECIGDMESLLSLNLAGNDFEGSIPSSYGGLSSINSLLLSRNKLSGSLPSTFSALRELRILDLEENWLEGSLGYTFLVLRDLPSLTELALNSNQVRGNVDPAMMMNSSSVYFPRLVALRIADNLLTGKLTSFTLLPALRHLDVSRNSFRGEIGIADLDSLSTFAAAGNPRLVSASGSLPEGLFAKDMWTLDSGGNFSCPELSDSRGSMIAALDSSYYRYMYCRCEVGYYGHPSTSYGCIPCLEGAWCAGGQDVAQRTGCGPNERCDEAEIIIPSGFYPVPLEPRKVDQSDIDESNTPVKQWATSTLWLYPVCSDNDVSADSGDDTYACVYTSPRYPRAMESCDQPSSDVVSCNPQEEAIFECETGYFGRKCAQCVDDYYGRGRTCVECEIAFAVLFAMFFISFCIGYTYHLCRRTPKLIRMSNAFRISLWFMQISSLLFAQSAYRWPTELLWFDGLYQFANVDISQMACFGTSGYNFTLRYFLQVLSPVWTAGVAALGFLLARHGDNWREHALRCLFMWHVGVDLLYLPTTVRIMATWNCEDSLEYRDGEPIRYMDSLPWVECDMDGEYWYAFVFSIVWFIVFSLGFPVATCYIAWRNRETLFEGPVFIVFTSLLDGVRPEAWWYGFSTYVRRFLLSMVLSLVPADSSFAAFFIFIVLCASLMLLHPTQPYIDLEINRLEMMSIYAVVGTFIVGLIFSSETMNDDVTLDISAFFAFIMHLTLMLIYTASLLSYLTNDRVGSGVMHYLGQISPHQRYMITTYGGSTQMLPCDGKDSKNTFLGNQRLYPDKETFPVCPVSPVAVSICKPKLSPEKSDFRNDHHANPELSRGTGQNGLHGDKGGGRMSGARTAFLNGSTGDLINGVKCTATQLKGGHMSNSGLTQCSPPSPEPDAQQAKYAPGQSQSVLERTPVHVTEMQAMGLTIPNPGSPAHAPHGDNGGRSFSGDERSETSSYARTALPGVSPSSQRRLQTHFAVV